MEFNRLLVLVQQPNGWMLSLTTWPIMTGDQFEVCHCLFCFPSLSDRLKLGCLAIRLSDDSVLAQNAVGDIFQLGHNSSPGAVAPFNEIRSRVHCFTSFYAPCTAEPTRPKSNNSGAAESTYLAVSRLRYPQSADLVL